MAITYLWIALGGAIGSVARYGVSDAISRWTGTPFPWGTVIVNITGCFAIGVLATINGPNGRALGPSDLRLFLMVGICGGYTTFSSFSLQTLTLARAGDLAGAGANVAVSVVACLVAVWLGAAAGAGLNHLRGG